MTTPQKTSTKQERRASVQGKNPLDGVGNIADDDLNKEVPEEFRMPVVPAPEPQPAPLLSISAEDLKALVDNAVGEAVNAALAAPRYSEHEMRDMMTRARAEAATMRFAESMEPLPPQLEATVAHISSSGAAPHIDAAERVWIILDDNDEIPPGGQFIGINGVGYQLLAGVEAFVPKSVCEVLDNAVKSVPVLDQMTKQVIGWKNRKRFPYSLVKKDRAQELTDAYED